MSARISHPLTAPPHRSTALINSVISTTTTICRLLQLLLLLLLAFKPRDVHVICDPTVAKQVTVPISSQSSLV